MTTEPTRLHTEHMSVAVPDALEAQPFPNTDLALAFRDDDGQFTPNLVFTAEPQTAPVSDATVRVLRASRERYPNAWFPSVDFWGADLEGRRVTMLYPTDDARDVCVRQWVWATGTHHIFATASFLPFQAHWAEPTLESVVQSIEFTRPPERQQIGQPTEFPLNEDLSMRAGMPIERLDDARRDATPPAGMPIGEATIDLLKRSLSRLRIGQRQIGIPRADRGTEAAEELERLGFAQDGVLGPFGEQIGTTLTQGTVLVNVMVQEAGRVETLTATGRGAEVVIVHSAGTHESLAPRRATLVVCGIEQMIREVLEWVGVPPQYSQYRQERMTADEANQRVSASPSESSWRRITIDVPEVSRVTVVHEATGELLVIESIDDTTGEITFVTQPPGLLFEELRTHLWNRLDQTSE